MLKKKSNIRRKMLSSFFLFSILILSFLWAFQVLFLDSFYKSEKTNDLKYVVNEIKKMQDYNNLAVEIDNLSFDKEVCVEITNQFSSLFASQYFGKGCMRGEKEKNEYIHYFILSNQNEMSFEIKNQKDKNTTLLYASKLSNDRFVFVNTSIDPIDSTTKILIKQLMVVTVIVFFLSFVLSFILSKRLSDPLIQLNKQTKGIAKGDFTTVINDHSNILELNELSDTLNYTREELGKTEELRRDLMANVSHDLKTPLTMIKAYAEMASDLHSKSKVKRNEDLNIIISEVDRLSLLVQDILDLSKLQSNIDSLHYEEFDLIPFIQKIISKYQYLQEFEHYQFIFNSDYQKYIVSADSKKLEQVIYNLINNAINYTGEDNCIYITLSNHRLEIKDTGKGIKKEDLPYIWDRYYKNQKKHKRNVVGTGLGLSIVKQILEAHQFPYGVSSVEGEGTTFYFEIQNKKED